MNKRVVVAMSGGVDSSVAAALLKQQGYDVIGVTMCLGVDGSGSSKPARGKTAGRPNCCGAEGIADAKRVADILGIRHYVLDFGKVFRKEVIDSFFGDYSRGRTPNPCVICNEKVKFGGLLRTAEELDAEYFATGHYADIDRDNGNLLRKAKDAKKDQTYFLYRVNPEILRKVLFPVSRHKKSEIRKMARELQLPISDKPDSQEICFIPEKGLEEALDSNVKPKPGQVKDMAGNVLGKHRGIAYYTIGQRKGLGIAAERPLYITDIDAKTNTITVGDKEDAFRKSFEIKDVVFYGNNKENGKYSVRIRYLHKEAPAEVVFSGDRAEIEFNEPQFAVTPGQSAVFYKDDCVYGGGIIE
ncbi:MAG: tRNA 2-thiouridine(34) synthase MnmA [Elusimicrobiota bacterium]